MLFSDTIKFFEDEKLYKTISLQIFLLVFLPLISHGKLQNPAKSKLRLSQASFANKLFILNWRKVQTPLAPMEKSCTEFVQFLTQSIFAFFVLQSITSLNIEQIILNSDLKEPFRLFCNRNINVLLYSMFQYKIVFNRLYKFML